MKCSDIDDLLVLRFLAKHKGKWANHWDPAEVGDPLMLTVFTVMPDAPQKVRIAKMRQLKKRGLVDGCACGCRGDWVITLAGLVLVAK